MAKQSPKYIPPSSDEFLEKFINYIMRRGKKSIARRSFNNALTIIKGRGYKDPVATFLRAVSNVSPLLAIKAKRIGGAVYQVPIEVSPSRQKMFAFTWILNAARDKKGAQFAKKLADEIIEAAEGAGTAVKKKEDTLRMAQANKAFAHFARY